MAQDKVRKAQEKRELAALIRKYAAGLDERHKRDLLAYAVSIEAEADRLQKEGGEGQE